MKIYSVRSSVLPKELSTRLIRANNQAQALSFATRDFYTVELATQDQLVDLATNGVRVETAVEEAK